ncbi:hypothetical protein SERN_0308 [Serinibacter arcticus]|uniref:Uncharacterized protein n=1 Tax=Serinibacter arcticus TaxID=1655435 RepID=A0A4Z1E2G3_9MICO|nr:hypothetical protein SERN_0308 [Serinibacter arcticus]
MGTAIDGVPWLVGYRLDLTAGTREDFSWHRGGCRRREAGPGDVGSARLDADHGAGRARPGIVADHGGPDGLSHGRGRAHGRSLVVASSGGPRGGGPWGSVRRTVAAEAVSAGAPAPDATARSRWGGARSRCW